MITNDSESWLDTKIKESKKIVETKYIWAPDDFRSSWGKITHWGNCFFKCVLYVHTSEHVMIVYFSKRGMGKVVSSSSCILSCVNHFLTLLQETHVMFPFLLKWTGFH